MVYRLRTTIIPRRLYLDKPPQSAESLAQFVRRVGFECMSQGLPYDNKAWRRSKSSRFLTIVPAF